MICNACGKELPEGVAFCPSCGSPVVQKAFCQKCGKELAPGQGFCATCGAPVGEAIGNTPNVVSTSTQLQTAPLLSLRMQLWKNLGPASLWWLLSFGSPFRWKVDFFTDRIEMKSMFGARTFLLSDVAKNRVARNLLSRCLVLTMNDNTIYVIGRPTLFHIGAAKKAYQVIAPYIPDEKKGT